jgi:hypothetical protein
MNVWENEHYCEHQERGFCGLIWISEQRKDVLPYRKAVIHTLTDVQLDALGYTDRNAILVRTDMPPNQLVVTRPETHQYQALISFQVPFQEDPLTILRGWELVNVIIRGSQF